jgi:hypothetical protein
MSRSAKIALGVATAVPAVWMVVWFGYFIYGFVGTGPWPTFTAMFISMGVVVALGIGLTIFYAIHTGTNERLASDERIMWILLVTLFATFAQPVYWYLHVWRATEPARGWPVPSGPAAPPPAPGR